jgi:hypothetical protein
MSKLKAIRYVMRELLKAGTPNILAQATMYCVIEKIMSIEDDKDFSMSSDELDTMIADVFHEKIGE